MFDNWFWYDTIYMFVTSQYYVSNEGKGLGDGNIKSSKIFSILFNLTLQNTDNGTITDTYDLRPAVSLDKYFNLDMFLIN